MSSSNRLLVIELPDGGRLTQVFPLPGGETDVDAYLARLSETAEFPPGTRWSLMESDSPFGDPLPDDAPLLPNR